MRKLAKLLSIGLGLSLSLVFVNCGPQRPGVFSPTGFQNESHGYKVVALPGRDANRAELMPSDWQLDNFYRDETDELKPKTAPEYETKLLFDLDGDGKVDKTDEAFVHDLRWIHARHHGVIWVRSVPVSTELRNVDLDVLLADYVNEISGAGYEAVRFGGKGGVEEHRYVARLMRKTAGRLAGQEAIDSEIEVANSEQIKLDPTSRWQHARLVLARGPVPHMEHSVDGTDHPFPVVLVLGYENSPDHFAEGQPDFDNLLSRFTVHELSGFVPSPSATAPAPPVPAAVATPGPSTSAAVPPIPPPVASSAAP